MRAAMRRLAWDLDATYEYGTRHVLRFGAGSVYGRGSEHAAASCAAWRAPGGVAWIGALRYADNKGVSIAVFRDPEQFCTALRDTVAVRTPRAQCEVPPCSTGLASALPLCSADAVAALCDTLT